DNLFDFQANFAQVDVKVFQDVGGNARAFLDKAQQDMFGPDVFMVEALGLLIGQLHHLAGPIGKAFVHGTTLERVSMAIRVSSSRSSSVQERSRNQAYCASPMSGCVPAQSPR